MIERKIKIGIVGAGRVVNLLHLPVLKSLPDASVEWLCDIDKEKAEKTAKLFKVKAYFTDLDDCPNVDAVLLAIPVGYRQPVFEKCVKRGWAIFSEKPFAIDEAQHKHYLELTKKKIATVGFHRRYYASTNILKAVIASKIFGDVHEIWAAEGQKFRGTGSVKELYQADYQAAGGGVLIERGSHTIDQIFFILDALDFKIKKCAITEKKRLDYETKVIAELQTKDFKNVKFGLSMSKIRTLSNTIEIYFSKCVIKCGVLTNSKVSVFDQEGAFLFTIELDTGFGTQIYQPYISEWQDLINALRTQTQPRNSAASSMLVTKFIEACYHHREQK